VVIELPYRGKGHAMKLMQWAIAYCEDKFSGQLLFLSAQEYLIDFYKSLGFTAVSEIYLEDGIPHMAMKRLPNLAP
jgi:ElaA protein